MKARAIVLAISCLPAATAQDRPFRAETRVVQVPVTVAGAKGANVEGLTSADFTVLDDGTPQRFTLDTFGTGTAPISLAIAIQASGISTPALAKIRRIGGMIQPLIVGDRGEAAIVVFDTDIKWALDFTADPDAMQRAFKTLKTGSPMQARMFDAVVEAAGRLRDRKGRRVLLLISESRDRGSSAHLETAVEAVEREGIEVFAAPYSAQATTWIARPEELPPPSGGNYLTVFNELFRLGKTNHAQALTQATGGAEYPFLRERSLEKAVEKMGVDVHSQYILSFPVANAKKGMHQIDVTVADRSGARILRSRRAYWSP